MAKVVRKIKDLPVGSEVYFGFTLLGVVGVNIDKRLEDLSVMTEIPECECGLSQIVVTDDNRELVTGIYNAIKEAEEV